MKKSLLRIQAETKKGIDFLNEITKLFEGKVDNDAFELLEECLRKIFDNPMDKKILEDCLQKMKPYLNIEEQKIHLLVHQKAQYQQYDIETFLSALE